MESEASAGRAKSVFQATDLPQAKMPSSSIRIGSRNKSLKPIRTELSDQRRRGGKSIPNPNKITNLTIGLTVAKKIQNLYLDHQRKNDPQTKKIEHFIDKFHSPTGKEEFDYTLNEGKKRGFLMQGTPDTEFVK